MSTDGCADDNAAVEKQAGAWGVKECSADLCEGQYAEMMKPLCMKTCGLCDAMVSKDSGATPTPAGTTPAATKSVAVVSFKISGLDLTDLSDDHQNALKSEFKTAHAALAGVSEDKVKIMLEAGSIVVKAEIETADPEAVKSKMADPATATAITEKVKTSLPLLRAARAKGLTADDLSVSAPSTEVVTSTGGGSTGAGDSTGTTAAPSAGEGGEAASMAFAPFKALAPLSIALAVVLLMIH